MVIPPDKSDFRKEIYPFSKDKQPKTESYAAAEKIKSEFRPKITKHYQYNDWTGTVRDVKVKLPANISSVKLKWIEDVFGLKSAESSKPSPPALQREQKPSSPPSQPKRELPVSEQTLHPAPQESAPSQQTVRLPSQEPIRSTLPEPLPSQESIRQPESPPQLHTEEKASSPPAASERSSPPIREESPSPVIPEARPSPSEERAESESVREKESTEEKSGEKPSAERETKWVQGKREAGALQPEAARVEIQRQAALQRDATLISKEKNIQQDAQESWGFSSQIQRSALLYNVRLISLLTGSKNQAIAEGKETPSALMRAVSLLQALNGLKMELSELHALMEQLTKNSGELTKRQTAEFNGILQNLQTQLQQGLKELKNLQPNLAAGQENEKLPSNPLAAAKMLQEGASRLTAQAQAQMQRELENFSTRANAALTQEGMTRGAQTAEGTANPMAAQNLSKPSPSTPTLHPEMGRLLLEAGKAPPPSSQIPTSIRSAAELQNLAAQMQTKSISSAVNIALIYPLEKARDLHTPISPSKAKPSDQKEEKGKGFAHKAHVQAMALIPAGEAIIGDPFAEGEEDELPPRIAQLDTFLIAIYPITNGQYTDWLNEAIDEQSIEVSPKGIVYDRYRNILCEMHTAAPTSQLQMVVSEGKLIVDVLKGTEMNPVVHVSWFGAVAYCEHNGLRLPTEAEWEKAAGMQFPVQGNTLRKFRYGFGRDEISHRLANYKTSLHKRKGNHSLPIGFFNGITSYAEGKKQHKTEDALNNYGCYDMSGNVRQWVEEGDRDKIAKGGSYNTSLYELRVSARSFFDANSCFPDIGFRVALDASL